MAPQATLVPRFDDDYYYGFWYTKTGYAVRWSLFGIIVLIALLWVVGGYFHAKHRMKKGLPLKSYHSVYDHACSNPAGTVRTTNMARPRMAGYNNGYNMNAMPPPPIYDANNRPPEYQQRPPPGASKVDPSQWSGQPTNRPAESSMAGAGPVPEYTPPPGPPPAVMRQ
ncbi:uncharacterized protein BBA_00268 [Beauveria bassiana ARSEF 2860]|uniref:Uncharacterized protein n=1 Tax=Beauveria bassiana (strain ARSEF 2860) TaxID=655819 RepID=J5K2N5_BEAB2|nr:uncharacterized protein BBA_00268 [Beauveria bassiana ARSEF 2860]EJP70638.1 hypothetical protein BBA_00268 [Beauveria bassiana ARSEF 2860]